MIVPHIESVTSWLISLQRPVIVCTLFSVIMLTQQSCSPVIENRGYVSIPNALSQLRSGGQQTKTAIRAVLGTPSSVSIFDDSTWHYISSKERRFAFSRPREIERQILTVQFNEFGFLKAIKIYSLNDGKPINPVMRVTHTLGSEASVLGQLLGNIGRFNRYKNQVEQ